ncbi:hypothetical protein Peur_056260 [Populus x canadensis]
MSINDHKYESRVPLNFTQEAPISSLICNRRTPPCIKSFRKPHQYKLYMPKLTAGSKFWIGQNSLSQWLCLQYFYLIIFED